MSTSATDRPRTILPSRPAAPRIDDTRIRDIMELAPPAHLLREFPASERAAGTTYGARQAIHRLLHDSRAGVVISVGRLTRLKENVWILRTSAQHRPVRRQRAVAIFRNQLCVVHLM